MIMITVMNRQARTPSKPLLRSPFGGLAAIGRARELLPANCTEEASIVQCVYMYVHARFLRFGYAQK